MSFHHNLQIPVIYQSKKTHARAIIVSLIQNVGRSAIQNFSSSYLRNMKFINNEEAILK